MGLESLGADFSSSEVDALFRFMDLDRDGYISFGVFCQALEKENARSGREAMVFTPPARSEQRSVDGRRLQSAERMVEKVWRYKKRSKAGGSLLPSTFDNSFTYGVPNVHPDSIGDVMSFNYQKEWIDKVKRLESE